MNTLINKVSTNVAKYLSMPGFNRSAYPSSMTDEDVFAAVRKELGDAVEAANLHTEHTWNDGVITTQPTCTEDGVRTYTCIECGETYTEAIPATGHTWDNGVVTTPPTYTTSGVKTFTCTVCGATYTEQTPVLPPKIGDVNGDGVVNMMDIRSLKRYLAGAVPTEIIVAVNSDMIDDGAINMQDLKALKQMLAG